MVDIGAGTGTGTDRLAAHFDDAEIVAVDHSPELAAMLTERARRGGYLQRVRTVAADLDDGWPTAAGTPDVVWASSSLHHIADPDRFLRELSSALVPDGILAVVEIDGAPRFLPDDAGVGRPGLEDRCERAMSSNGWNSFPEWTTQLRGAGFDVLDQVTIRVEPDGVPPQAAEYAVQWYTRLRTGLADVLDADDLAALDILLDDQNPLALRRRADLSVRAGRLVWIARPTERTNP